MQNDKHPLAFELSHAFGRPHRAGQDSSIDSGSSEFANGDFAEGLAEDWEAAWIDLGGEG
jgi:hypothetical protein